jgi:hypothetical protein
MGVEQMLGERKMLLRWGFCGIIWREMGQDTLSNQ